MYIRLPVDCFVVPTWTGTRPMADPTQFRPTTPDNIRARLIARDKKELGRGWRGLERGGYSWI